MLGFWTSDLNDLLEMIHVFEINLTSPMKLFRCYGQDTVIYFSFLSRTIFYNYNTSCARIQHGKVPRPFLAVHRNRALQRRGARPSSASNHLLFIAKTNRFLIPASFIPSWCWRWEGTALQIGRWYLLACMRFQRARERPLDVFGCHPISKPVPRYHKLVWTENASSVPFGLVK